MRRQLSAQAVRILFVVGIFSLLAVAASVRRGWIPGTGAEVRQAQGTAAAGPTPSFERQLDQPRPVGQASSPVSPLALTSTEHSPSVNTHAGNPGGKPGAGGKSLTAELSALSFPFFRGDSRASGHVPHVRLGSLRERWRLRVGEGRIENTITVGGGCAYVALSHGDLVALEVDKGKPRWRWHSPGGWTASPSLAGDRLYIGDGDGRFFCLDANTGKVYWEFRTEGPIDSPANVVDNRVLFGSQDGNLYCVDALSGQLRWTYTSEDQIRSFPSVADGRVLVAGCDGQLHVLDLDSGEKLCQIPLGGPTGNAAAVIGTTAFVGTEHGAFLAVDFRKGEVLWTFGDASRPVSIRTSAAVTGEVVIFGARDRKVRALRAADGELVWEFTARGAVDSSPVATADSVIFGSDDGRLYILDLATGKQKLVYEVGGRLSAPPTVCDGMVLAGTSQGEVICWQIVAPQ